MDNTVDLRLRLMSDSPSVSLEVKILLLGSLDKVRPQ
jgi:hypothetical protein